MLYVLNLGYVLNAAKLLQRTDFASTYAFLDF